ncbi:unnamed protein product, partial [Cladocopium goreaui]
MVLSARQLTAKISKSKNIKALQSLYQLHGDRMDRLHLSALLHRCGQVPKSEVGLPVWLKEVVGRLHCDAKTPRELASGLWALAKLRAMAEAEEWLKELPEEREWKPQELSNTLWALATLSLKEEMWYKTLAQWSTKRMESMEGQHLANISWALATVSHEDEIWFSALHKEMSRRREMNDLHLEPKQLANIFWAMSKLGFRGSLLWQLGDDLSRPGRLDHFQGRDLAALVRAYASLEVLHEGLFRSVASAAQKTLTSFSSQDLQNLSWAYALAMRFGLWPNPDLRSGEDLEVDGHVAPDLRRSQTPSLLVAGASSNRDDKNGHFDEVIEVAGGLSEVAVAVAGLEADRPG